jgi:hypothetical protein
MHERRRGERVARADRELAACGSPQLVIDEGNDLVESFAPAGPQICEQFGDARGIALGRCRV